MITARKTYRALSAMLPAWLLVVFAACLVIPGPFDEAAIIVTAAVLGLVQPVRFRRAASAWRGGKSHRAYDSKPVAYLVSADGPSAAWLA